MRLTVGLYLILGVSAAAADDAGRGDAERLRWLTAETQRLLEGCRVPAADGTTLFRELVDDFRQRGVCECIHDNYRQLESYVVSATNPLAAVRRLEWEGKLDFAEPRRASPGRQ